jgi:hypothetical protein
MQMDMSVAQLTREFTGADSVHRPNDLTLSDG